MPLLLSRSAIFWPPTGTSCMPYVSSLPCKHFQFFVRACRHYKGACPKMAMLRAIRSVEIEESALERAYSSTWLRYIAVPSGFDFAPHHHMLVVS